MRTRNGVRITSHLFQVPQETKVAARCHRHPNPQDMRISYLLITPTFVGETELSFVKSNQHHDLDPSTPINLEATDHSSVPSCVFSTGEQSAMLLRLDVKSHLSVEKLRKKEN